MDTLFFAALDSVPVDVFSGFILLVALLVVFFGHRMIKDWIDEKRRQQGIQKWRDQPSQRTEDEKEEKQGKIKNKYQSLVDGCKFTLSLILIGYLVVVLVMSWFNMVPHQ